VTEFETQFRKLLNKNKEILEKGNLQEYFDGYTYEGVTECQEMSRSAYVNWLYLLFLFIVDICW
jgi:hypothetical protein